MDDGSKEGKKKKLTMTYKKVAEGKRLLSHRGPFYDRVNIQMAVSSWRSAEREINASQ